MKDEPILSSYIADSYQKLFEEIKKKLKCPISFAQYKNSICLLFRPNIDKSTYNLLIRKYLNNPFTNKLIKREK